MSNNQCQGPYTAIVVGSGCSVSLGVPTMVGFLDTLIDRLADPAFYDGAERDLHSIQLFITRIKGAAAYVRADLLNIEELYGMADMDEDLWRAAGRPDSKEWYGSNAPGSLSPSEVKAALNRAIYAIAEPAGKEFLKQRDRFPQSLKELEEVKRESATESTLHENRGTRWTNLLAYLCLASFRDRSGRYPLFVQFNWDLALDRALNHWCILKNNRDLDQDNDCEGSDPISWLPWYGTRIDGKLDYYDCWPRLARPHGGINWIACDQQKAYEYHKSRLERSNLWNDTEKRKLKDRLRHEQEELKKYCHLLYPQDNKEVWIDTRAVYADETNLDSNPAFRSGSFMEIVPPTWRKQAVKPVYSAQWGYINQELQDVRRIVFIGYSLPRTDLYFRHFLALSLADNPHLPRVYVVNPGIEERDGEVRNNYLDLFEPLAREGRLYGVAAKFGEPALFDLHRVFTIAKPIRP